MKSIERINNNSVDHDTALTFLAQDILAQQLRGTPDPQYQEATNQVNQAMDQGNRKRTRRSLNNLVHQANNGSVRDAYYLFLAMRQRLDDSDKHSLWIDRVVSLHLSQILTTGFFIDKNSFPTTKGCWPNGTHFNFVLEARQNKLKREQHLASTKDGAYTIRQNASPCQLPLPERLLAVAHRDNALAWENARTDQRLACRLFRSSGSNMAQADRLSGENLGSIPHSPTGELSISTTSSSGHHRYRLSGINGLTPVES